MGTTRDDLTSDLDLELPDADAPLPTREPDEDTLYDEEIRAESISATFGSSTRSGFWPPADHLRAKAVFGEVKLDFREATLPQSGVVEVHATAVFGSVRLIVPPGSVINLTGSTAFGEFGHRPPWQRLRAFFRRLFTGEDEPPDPEPDPELSPIFNVSGSAVFGDVSVSTR